MTRISFVSADGLSPDPSKVDAIDQVPPPMNLTELKSFLRMIKFYTNFIAKLADIIEPLHELKCKDVRMPERQAAFEEAKANISVHLKLALFDPHLPTHVS